jgi:hypothetical protein
MIQYLHKISGEITETTQCIITIGEHQDIFKMILSHHRGSFHEEIQCYGKIDRENENIILIVDKIYKMNFNSSFTRELFMDYDKLYIVIEKLEETKKIDDSCYEYDLMEEGANINLNDEYDTLLQFINFKIPRGCNEDEATVFETIHKLKDRKFIKL